MLLLRFLAKERGNLNAIDRQQLPYLTQEYGNNILRQADDLMNGFNVSQDFVRAVKLYILVPVEIWTF